jgi:hypothetical protein
MKITFLAISLLILSIHVYSSDTTSVLFIGNSITYTNNVPMLFEKICKSKGKQVTQYMHAVGGATLANHLNNPQVHNLFMQGNWDYIILQASTNEAIGWQVPINQTINYCKQLTDSAYKYNPCAQVILFENPTAYHSASTADSVNYFIEQAAIKANITAMADSVKLPLAPIGEGYKLSRLTDYSLFLWNAYADIHPNMKGSYLDACILYSSIFQSSVMGATTYTLSPTTANYLQTIADSIVLNFLPNWRINTWNHTTNFSYTTNIDSVSFVNLSTNIDSLVWDFGDGNFSKTKNPIHKYSSKKTYYITLISYQHGCSQTHKDTVVISLSSGIYGQTSTICKLYPNPASKQLSIENTYNINKIEIYDITGKTMKVVNKKTKIINIAELPTGIYFIKLIADDRIIIKKFIKN